jgi:protein-S-isoprenylcysteine O-methyltransferase Ste14
MTYLVALDVDPSTVRPGWIAFVVVLLLAIALVFLFFSMRRQFRKINISDPEKPSEPGAASTSGRDAEGS